MISYTQQDASLSIAFHTSYIFQFKEHDNFYAFFCFKRTGEKSFNKKAFNNLFLSLKSSNLDNVT